MRALSLSHLAKEAVTLTRSLNDYFWMEKYGVYFQSSLSGSPSTVLSGWAAEILLLLSPSSSFATNELQNNHQNINQNNRSMQTLRFVAATLTDQWTGAVYQDSYPDGSNRRYGDGTYFTLDCAYGLRYFAVASGGG